MLQAVPRGIKDLVRDTFVHDLVRSARHRRAVEEWERSGRPVPAPHAVKVATVREYGRRFGLSGLVETGTFRGDMVYAVRRDFDHIVSIELNEALADKARARLRGHPHVSIVQGDSATMLSRVLEGVKEPWLFWLDGHWVPNSGSITSLGDRVSPILRELDQIWSHPVRDHVILVDDARCFNGDGYPTLDELRESIARNRPGWVCEVETDIIRIHRP